MRQPDAGTFGHLFRKHRIERGLKQDDLADRLGYAGSSRHAIVSRIETASDGEFANPEQVAKLLSVLHAERTFTLTEIHQLATTYLGLESLSASSERSHLAVAIAGVAFSSFWSGVVANLAICAGPWCNLVLRTHGEDLGSEQEILLSFVARAHSLYGVILAPALGLYRGPTARQMEIRRELVRQLQERDVPVVLLDRRFSDADQAALRYHAPVVSLEHYDAGRKAVRKLYEAGHQRIGVLLDLEHCQVQRERCRGAVDEMQAQGLEVDRRLIVFGTAGQQVDPSALGDSPFGFHNARMNAGALVAGREGLPPPTALLCTTSYVTLEAYTAIVRDRRLKIPEQVSLLGFDDVNELRRLGISRVPYRPSDAARNAFEKIKDYYDPARKAQAYRDHIWTVSYADTDWAIATHEEPGTIRNVHDSAVTATISAVSTPIFGVHSDSAATTSSPSKLSSILFVNPLPNQPQWRLIGDYIAKQAKALGVKETETGPSSGALDTTTMIQQIQEGIANHVGAILTFPASSDFEPVLEQARKAGIIVGTLCGAGAFKAANVDIGANFQSLGRLYAQSIAERIGPQRVGLLTQGPTGAAKAFEDAFKAEAQKTKNVTVDAVVYTGDDASKAFDATVALLTTHPDITVIASHEGTATAGAIAAIKEKELVGKVVFVANGASGGAQQGLEAGTVYRVLLQNWCGGGHSAVSAVAGIAGGKMESAAIPVGMRLVGRDNYKRCLTPGWA